MAIPESYVEPVQPRPGNSARLWGGFLYAAAALAIVVAAGIVAFSSERSFIIDAL